VPPNGEIAAKVIRAGDFFVEPVLVYLPSSRRREINRWLAAAACGRIRSTERRRAHAEHRGLAPVRAVVGCARVAADFSSDWNV